MVYISLDRFDDFCVEPKLIFEGFEICLGGKVLSSGPHVLSKKKRQGQPLP
jgi:hypothetical protein